MKIFLLLLSLVLILTGIFLVFDALFGKNDEASRKKWGRYRIIIQILVVLILVYKYFFVN